MSGWPPSAWAEDGLDNFLGNSDNDSDWGAADENTRWHLGWNDREPARRNSMMGFLVDDDDDDDNNANNLGDRTDPVPTHHHGQAENNSTSSNPHPPTSPPRHITNPIHPPSARASGSAAIRNILNDDPPGQQTNTSNQRHSPATRAARSTFPDIFHDHDFESGSDEFLTLEDSDRDITPRPQIPSLDAMPSATRRTTQNRRQSVVDLTSNSPPTSAQPTTSTQPSRRRKRSADDSAGRDGTDNVLKRSRLVQGPVEEVDLLDEAPSVEEELLQAQQKATIKAQQEEVAAGPQKIGKRQCIICMENLTNATATACGHFYCHECLIQALLAGEKNSDRGIGTCPVCRKPLSRNSRKKYDIIPIAFMKKSQFADNERRRHMA